jgi:hypothetical protein
MSQNSGEWFKSSHGAVSWGMDMMTRCGAKSEIGGERGAISMAVMPNDQKLTRPPSLG